MSVAPSNQITFSSLDSDEGIAQNLFPFVKSDPERFKRIITKIQFDSSPTSPGFPDVDVSTIPPVPSSALEEFTSFHIDESYVRWGSDEGKKRAAKARELQYKRWNWAKENVTTYVNVLRVAGFSDESISLMFKGTPLCFQSDDEYMDFRKALAELAPRLEKQHGWTYVNFLITGSSVPGFSQNPLKGIPDRPTKITSPASSDVDVVIVGGGVSETMMSRMSKELSEPCRCFNTTASDTVSATRFGCVNMAEFCPVLAEFHSEWNEKLPAGLQLTFGEHNVPIPPWEARIDTVNI